MSGFFIKTGASDGSQAQDPAFFNVWATNDDVVIESGACAAGRRDEKWWEGKEKVEWCGAKWERVGTPKWKWKYDAGFEPQNHGAIDFVQLPVSLPAERQSLQTFLLRPPWHLFYVFHVLVRISHSIGMCMAVVAARLRYTIVTWPVPAPNIVVAAGFAGGSALACYAGLVALAAGETHLAGEYLGRLVAWVIIPVILMRQGQWFFYQLSVYTVLDITMSMGITAFFFHDPFARSPTQTGMLSLLLCIMVIALRHNALIKSKRMLRDDQNRYNTLWATLCEHEDNIACIEHLKKVVTMIGLQEKDFCRQHNRLRADRLAAPLQEKYLSQAARNAPVNPLFWELGHWFVPGRHQKGDEVKSLNQLYFQAAISNLLLMERIKEWADRSEGYFFVQGDSQGALVKWSDVKGTAAEESVRWTSIKRHTRAIEKLHRSYENVMGRLLDISRNAIVFENMTHLTNALGIIVTDENVRVERLKNRLSPDYDSAETGGYRDVCINLRVVSKESESYGAELHISEVQLMLKEFADLKTGEGHRRYVLARNTKGT
mmetsp:Transcript_38555/g.89794  ORF Transcript_38555/g.89794 Transcript_38555/m.89794 type:complete len:545 (+) Transcript_38555:3503-5137(+)